MRILLIHRRRPRGQSLVEFALILPVFLLLFGTVLDLGRIAAAQVTITAAAREGAFEAARTPTDYDPSRPCPADAASNRVICRTLLEARNTGVVIAPSDVLLSCDPACDDGVGHRVTVRVAGRFQLLTPFLTPFFGGSQEVRFSAASTQQIETFPPAPSPVILTSAPPSTAPSAPPSAATPPPDETPCSLPSAGFTYAASPANRKAPVTVTFTDTSTSIACGITTWFWDFGDGSTSLVRNPSPKTYVAAGTYVVTLTVANAAGSNTSGAATIEVRP